MTWYQKAAIGLLIFCVGSVVLAVLLCGWRNALSLFVPGIASNADNPHHDRPKPPSGDGENWTEDTPW